jgi:hypothetical protein
VRGLAQGLLRLAGAASVARGQVHEVVASRRCLHTIIEDRRGIEELWSRN